MAVLLMFRACRYRLAPWTAAIAAPHWEELRGEGETGANFDVAENSRVVITNSDEDLRGSRFDSS
jgi:hypothetical protein